MINKNLYVNEFPEFYQEDDLREIFEEYGEIESLAIKYNQSTQKP